MKLRGELYEKIMHRMGKEVDDDLNESIRKGEWRKDMIQDRIKKYVGNLTPEQKEEIRQKMMNEKDEMRDIMKDRWRDVKARELERRSDRAEKIGNMFEKRANWTAGHGFENRSNKMQQKADWFQNRSEHLDERADRMRSK